jgi:hypothetical protein
MEIEGGSEQLQRYAKNIPLETIKKILNDINKAKDKRTHVIYKDLIKSK